MLRHAGGVHAGARGCCSRRLPCSVGARRPPWRCARAAKDGAPNPGKADFSAYWSLKFREFFSKRRRYLDQATRRQDPSERLKSVDARIEALQQQLDANHVANRQLSDAEQAQYLGQLQGVLDEVDALLREGKDPAGPELAAKQADLERLVPKAGLGYSLSAPSPHELLQADVAHALGELHTTRAKVFAITPIRLRAAARALVLLPFTLPAALFRAWQALFASQRYENFLMAEGERIWYWRNRTENERWFWEEFFLPRMVIPAAWTLCYLAVVPNNLLWAVVVPFVLLCWQDGRVPTPGNMEWWLIMVFGLYGKCWDQVLQLLAFFFRWW